MINGGGGRFDSLKGKGEGDVTNVGEDVVASIDDNHILQLEAGKQFNGGSVKESTSSLEKTKRKRRIFWTLMLTVATIAALSTRTGQNLVGAVVDRLDVLATETKDYLATMTPTAELTTESPTHADTPTPTSTPRIETPTITPEQQLLAKINEMSSDFKADNNCDGDCGPLDVEVKTVSIGGEHFFKYIVSPVGAHASKNVQDGRNGEGLYLPILDNQEEPGHVAQKFIPGILEDGVRVYYSPVVTSEKTYLNNTARFAPEDRKDRDIRWDLRTIKAVDSRGPAVAFDDANENNGYLVFKKVNDGWEEETIIPDQPTPAARIESAFTDQQRIATAMMNLEDDPFKLDRGTRHISP